MSKSGSSASTSRQHRSPSRSRPTAHSSAPKRQKLNRPPSPEDGELPADNDEDDGNLSAISSASEPSPPRRTTLAPQSALTPSRSILDDNFHHSTHDSNESFMQNGRGLLGDYPRTPANPLDVSLSPGRLNEALAVLDPFLIGQTVENGMESYAGTGEHGAADLSFGAMSFDDDLFDIAGQEALLDLDLSLHPTNHPYPTDITPYDLYGSPLSTPPSSPPTSRSFRIFSPTDPELDEYRSESEQEEEFGQDNVDAMLDGVDPDDATAVDRVPLVRTREKYILVEKSHQLFEFLPTGWLKVMHESGMPVYYHRESRICTLSRPYGLGKASLRSHKIPLSAVPCMEYRRCKEQTAGQNVIMQSGENSSQDVAVTDPANPTSSDTVTARVMTADQHYLTTLITPEELRTYCTSLFQFHCKTIRRYKNWKIGRGRQRLVKKLKTSEAPSRGNQSQPEVTTMLKKTKVVTITRPGPDENVPLTFTLNPTNKTVVSILHEFIQHVKKTQPVYEFLEMPDSNAPYQAVVTIDGKEEGRGMGASKKAAKLAAAKEALIKVAPEMRSVVEVREGEDDEDIFHDIPIDDPRVWEISFKAGIPAPYEILTRALKRTHRSEPIKLESKRLGHLKNEYTMTCGDLSISVISQKRDAARHLCAQKLLIKVHPELSYYGQLLKLYGTQQQRNLQKKKEVQRTITDLQTKAKWGQPNWELLEKLKAEMAKVVPVALVPGERSRIRYD